MTYVSVFEKQLNPIRLGLIILGGVTLISVGAKLIDSVGLMESKDIFPWEMAFSGILFFALFNAIFSLSSKDPNKYWMHSIFSFVGLVIASSVLAWLLSGLTMDEAGSFRWILMIFTFSYLLILTIVRAMRKIVGIAQKQDARLHGEIED
jgi:hypothetical protein